MASNGTLVRTDLTGDEYAEIRKVAIDRRVSVSKLAGDHMRKLIPDASKGKGK